MAQRKKTILIIDDEASVRKVINKALLNEGYHVLEAENHDEAAAKVNDGLGRIDMLLIDVSLPGKNGFMTAKALRDINPNLKLLFMSAPVGAEWSRYHGVPVTDVHFLPKPFTAAELLERVKYVLSWTAPLSARGAL
jgi:two-component system, cell cycle sensor histidine kinase and response regulator CckA